PPSFLEYRIDMLEPVLQGYAKAGTTRFCVLSPTESPQVVEDKDDLIEIDEDFLANSVLQPTLRPSSIDASSEVSFQVRELIEPVSEDDSLCYVRTSDLGRIGLLDGDWAVARCSTSSDYRLVRVIADDDITEEG